MDFSWEQICDLYSSDVSIILKEIENLNAEFGNLFSECGLILTERNCIVIVFLLSLRLKLNEAFQFAKDSWQ